MRFIAIVGDSVLVHSLPMNLHETKQPHPTWQEPL